MKALFITADGLECMQEVPESLARGGFVLRPIQGSYRELLSASDEALKLREYRMENMRDGVAIFREVSLK